MNRDWKLQCRPAVLIVLLTIVAYLPAMRGGFVFDDALLITNNRLVRASDGLYRFWFTGEAPDFFPLTSSLWWLEWRVWGANPMGYHVVNVVLHAVNAVLVWIILRRLKIPAAWLTALVFAIHPVNVATVAWISELKNTLSMLFYLIAILLYLEFDDPDPQGAKGRPFRWHKYALSLGAFLLALLSKAAVVMLPVVLLSCAWWSRGKMRRKDFLCIAPFFVLSFAFGLVTIWFQYNRALGGIAVRTDSFLSRFVSAGWVPWFYLSKVLLPLDLTVVYPHWNIDPSQWVAYLPGGILASSFVVFWWKRNTWGRPFLFGLGYFVVMLFPVLGFFDIAFYAFSLVADHWQYYSIVGVIALAVAVGERICRSTGECWRYVELSLGAVVLIVLGVATWKRAYVYADSQTLWEDNVAKNPDAWVAQNYLGSVLSRAGRIHEAIVHYEQALRINTEYVDAHNNLGNALLQTGEIQDAMRQYEQALRIKPDSAVAHYNLGVALSQVGNLQSAIVHFEQAVQIDPDYPEAHNNLGSALSIEGRIKEAIKHYEQALRLMPDSPEVRCNLAMALEQAGNVKEAREQYEEVLRTKPQSVEAQNGLARLRAVR
jgi:protein O-mannosyl-transferase